MKRNIVILAIALILTGLLGFSSISLAQGGKWEKKADMPTARQFLSASAVNGLIYAMGGQDAFDDHLRRLATVEVYNPATDTWKKGTDMLAPRSQFATAVVDGKNLRLWGVLLSRAAWEKNRKNACDRRRL